jgi:hypothetical protein
VLGIEQGTYVTEKYQKDKRFRVTTEIRKNGKHLEGV